MADNFIVTDATISASELNSLDNQYSGTVDATAVTTITGTAAAINTVYSSSGISGLGNEAVTMTDNHTLAQLKTINNAIGGVLTLGDYTVALSGSSSDVAAALSGSFAAVHMNATSSSILSIVTSISRPSPGEISITASGATLDRVTSTELVAILSWSSYIAVT